jgi:hypothetical protein
LLNRVTIVFNIVGSLNCYAIRSMLNQKWLGESINHQILTAYHKRRAIEDGIAHPLHHLVGTL